LKDKPKDHHPMSTANTVPSLRELLEGWTEARAQMRNANLREHDAQAWRAFLDFMSFHGVQMPATAEEVCGYLFQLMSDGVRLSIIRRAARAIQAGYVERQCYLDPRVIEAAIDVVESQLKPGRTLN
jgi:DNA-binding transcriptional regulator YbjK